MNPARALVLAIDLGTSGPKVALSTSAGEILAAASRGVDTLLPGGGGAEQNADQIWRAVLEAAAQVLRESKVGGAKVTGVAVSSQFSSIVPVDREGLPLSNLILWMDRRGASHGRQIYQRHPDALETWIEIHGRKPSPSGGDSLAHILFVQNDRPEVYAATHAFLEPMDYLAMRLTGECTANVCTAFSTLLTDNRDLDRPRYHPRLLEMAGVDSDRLPTLVAVNSRIGALRPEVAAELGLSTTTAVFSGTNDTQAASVAAGSFRRGPGGIHIGTTAQILASAEGKLTDITRDLLTMPSPIRGRRLVLAENGIAGKSLEHFIQNVVFACDTLADHSAPDPFDRIEQALRASSEGSDGLIFLPWLTGIGSPLANDRVRGAFLNISLKTGRTQMMRAIFEGVAFSLRWLREAVESFTDQTLRPLYFSGGGARSNGWAQILADIMGRPVRQLENARFAGCRAAAFLAFEQLGMVDLWDVESFSPVRREYEPRPEHRETYDRLYEQFLNAFHRNVPIFEALNP